MICNSPGDQLRGRFDFGKTQGRPHPLGDVINAGRIPMVTKDCHTTSMLRSRATAPATAADLEPPRRVGVRVTIGYIGSCWSGPTCKIELDYKRSARRLSPCPSCLSGDHIYWGCHTDQVAWHPRGCDIQNTQVKNRAVVLGF